MAAADLTICALLYGDHEPLARRLLTSLEKLPHDQYRFRLGLNETCDDTNRLVKQYLSDRRLAWDEPATFYCRQNAHKYPLMREMFYGRCPLRSPYVMWFDDDSWITADDGQAWLRQVWQAMRGQQLIGKRYYLDLSGAQSIWIRYQPWFNHKPLMRRASIPFATGGWWVAELGVLRRWDWPWPSLDHNGGDQLLGALFQQQNLRRGQFEAGVAINADSLGRHSKAARRGYHGRQHGADFVPGKPLPAIPAPAWEPLGVDDVTSGC